MIMESDTDGDMTVSMMDDIDPDHYDFLLYNCDSNMDGVVEACEMFDCVIVAENDWRVEYCPNEELLECECPFDAAELPEMEEYDEELCEGLWECDDVM